MGSLLGAAASLDAGLIAVVPIRVEGAMGAVKPLDAPSARICSAASRTAKRVASDMRFASMRAVARSR